MSKTQTYVLIPIDQKRFGIMDSVAMVEKFANRWKLTPVIFKEDRFFDGYWNQAMCAYLRRPRGYLRTHAVFVYLANTPLTARRAVEQWHKFLDQYYEMKPFSAALQAFTAPRRQFLEKE